MLCNAKVQCLFVVNQPTDQADLLHGLPLIENDTMIICKDTITKHKHSQHESKTTAFPNEKMLPIIYFVTPTYPR